jgi:hypothetical protein
MCIEILLKNLKLIGFKMLIISYGTLWLQLLITSGKSRSELKLSIDMNWYVLRKPS